ncbi:MAG TPA: hypothetical protein VGB45_07040 [Abditibacterium sp.]|jgi:hypothetical protein
MEKFELAPWELPPDCNEPLLASAEAKATVALEGRKTSLLLRSVQVSPRTFIVFFRDTEKSDLDNQIILNSTGTQVEILGPNRPTLALHKFASELASQQLRFARIFRLEPPLHRMPCVVTGQMGAWIDHRWRLCSKFQLAQNQNGNSRSTRQHLSKEWLREDSDFRFSRLWVCAGNGAKVGLLYGTEFGWIMKRVLISHPTIWNDRNECHWTINTNPKHARIGFLSSFSGNLSYPNISVEEDSYLLAWSLFLRNHYLASVVDAKIRQHSCVSRQANRFTRKGFSVGFGLRPTAHERLETSLALREWLKGKVSDADAARLFPI